MKKNLKRIALLIILCWIITPIPEIQIIVSLVGWELIPIPPFYRLLLILSLITGITMGTEYIEERYTLEIKKREKKEKGFISRIKNKILDW